MPARNPSEFPEPGSDENIVPLDLIDDDAIWTLLNAYADGEASAEEMLRVESLMRSHPGVARELSFLQLTADSIHEFDEVEPPAALSSAIFAATARRKTFFQRASAWWASFGTSFGPTPLRFAGAALASGVLAVVFWSKFGAVHPAKQNSPAPEVTIQAPVREPVTPLPIGPMKPPTSATPSPKSQGNVALETVGPKLVVPAINEGPIGPLQQQAVAQTIVKPKLIGKSSGASFNDVHRDSVTRLPKVDMTGSGVVVSRANVEERHMSGDSNAGSTAAKPDELGLDVDTSTDTHTDEVAKATPAPNYDEPPTTVTVVSYLPGSISDKTRNAPPAYQSLAMRTQEYIRRQHEMQQYGGYGKDAYNNIQRREVGLSLVGGRF